MGGISSKVGVAVPSDGKLMSYRKSRRVISMPFWNALYCNYTSIPDDEVSHYLIDVLCLNLLQHKTSRKEIISHCSAFIAYVDQSVRVDELIQSFTETNAEFKLNTIIIYRGSKKSVPLKLKNAIWVPVNELHEYGDAICKMSSASTLPQNLKDILGPMQTAAARKHYINKMAENLVPGTRTWMGDRLSTLLFDDKRENRPLSLLYGYQSSGKSILLAKFCCDTHHSSFNADHCFNEYKSDGHRLFLAGYFFFQEEDSMMNCIISILGQLVASIPHFRKCLDSEALKGIDSMNCDEIFETLILQTIRNVHTFFTDKPEREFVVVLDGLNSKQQLNFICCHLANHASITMVPSWFKFLVSARKEIVDIHPVRSNSFLTRLFDLSKQLDSAKDTALVFLDSYPQMEQRLAKLLGKYAQDKQYKCNEIIKSITKGGSNQEITYAQFLDYCNKQFLDSFLKLYPTDIEVFHTLIDYLMTLLFPMPLDMWKQLATCGSVSEKHVIDFIALGIKSLILIPFENTKPCIFHRFHESKEVSSISLQIARFCIDLLFDSTVETSDDAIEYAAGNLLPYLFKCNEFHLAYEIVMNFDKLNRIIGKTDISKILQPLKELNQSSIFSTEEIECISEIYTVLRSRQTIIRSHVAQFASQLVDHINYGTDAYTSLPRDLQVMQQAAMNFILQHDHVQIWYPVCDVAPQLGKKGIFSMISPHRAPVIKALVSRKSKIIVTIDSNNFWQTWTCAGTPVGSLQRLACSEDAPLSVVAISDDGSRMAVVSKGRFVELWDLLSKTCISEPTALHPTYICSVVFSPDSTLLATGSDLNIRLWNTTTTLEKAYSGYPLKGHEDEILCLAFSDDGKFLVSCSYDQSIRMWNLNPPEPRSLGNALFGHTSRIHTVRFTKDCKHVTSISTNEIILWNVQNCCESEVIHRIDERYSAICRKYEVYSISNQIPSNEGVVGFTFSKTLHDESFQYEDIALAIFGSSLKFLKAHNAYMH